MLREELNFAAVVVGCAAVLAGQTAYTQSQPQPPQSPLTAALAAHAALSQLLASRHALALNDGAAP
jgi:hypothetical protein